MFKNMYNIFMKNIICLDCDGTLVNDKNKITEYSYNVLKKASVNNFIIYATGRNLEDFLVPFGKRKVIGDYLITNHGTIIYDLNNNFKVYKKFKILKKDFTKYYNTILKLNLNFKLGNVKNNNLNEYYKKYKDILSVDLYFEQKDVEKVYKVLKDFKNIKTFIMKDSFSDLNWICASSINSDKGIAINYLVKNKKITGKIIAIGDSVNDVSMMQIADIKVAMSNALNLLKQNCDYITSYSYKEDGACKWIEKYIIK